MLKSDRLQYRLFELDSPHSSARDIEEIWQIDQDPVVMQYLTGGVVTSRQALHETYLPRIRSYTDKAKGYGMWRVATHDDSCVGEIIVRPMHFFTQKPHFHDIELGWRFTRSAWGHGYATEAASRLMQYMHKRPEVTHFTAITDSQNMASINVMKKLGMTFIKHDVHHDPLGDVEVDFYRCTADRD